MENFDVDEAVEQAIMERLEREKDKAFTYLKRENICSTWKDTNGYNMLIRTEFGDIKLLFPHEVIDGVI